MNPCTSFIKRYPVLAGLRHFAIFEPLKLALTAVKLLTSVHHKALCRGHFKAKKKNHPSTKSLLSIDGS
jgi:hypothetical protein